jgi:hypothetical protein
LNAYKAHYAEATAESVALRTAKNTLAEENVGLEKEVKKLKLEARKKKPNRKRVKKISAKAKKASATMKATWYTGDVLGFRGSYGKLHHGKSIALNASQRNNLGVKKQEWVYLDFPGRHEDLSGNYQVMDSGCSSGIVDMFYASKGSVPGKFKQSGVVRDVKLYRSQ